MRLALAIALSCCAAGCAAPVGDFGRREDSVFANAMTVSNGPFSPAAGIEPSRFILTDDENELRNVAWDLVRPPDRDVPGNSLSNVAWWRALPDHWYGGYPDAYWRALQLLPVSSSEVRFNRIIQQARTDSQRLPAFRDVASRVGVADGARRQAVAAVGADRAMSREAERRIAENRGVVEAVCRALAIRIRAYRSALHRLMVETPSTRAVEAEAAIDGLAWEAGDCGGTLRVRGAGVIDARPRDRFIPRSEGPAVIK